VQLADRVEGGHRLPVLIWRLPEPVLAISSGTLGGGVGFRNWIVNATVDKSYSRMDPAVHLAELATAHDLRGPGVGLLTAVDVRQREIAVDGGVEAVITVGLSVPTWAAAPDGDGTPAPPGTINSVVRVPVRLDEAALVNAVITATEAKVQALADAGVAATGTASDAICIVCPADGIAEPFAGPRSIWGARLARAVHSATKSGAEAWCRTRAVG
jgi:adenosylcobinamide hydrolase